MFGARRRLSRGGGNWVAVTGRCAFLKGRQEIIASEKTVALFFFKKIGDIFGDGSGATLP